MSYIGQREDEWGHSREKQKRKAARKRKACNQYREWKKRGIPTSKTDHPVARKIRREAALATLIEDRLQNKI